MSEQNNRLVLVAAIGTSPAVLTETVWALAHEKGGRVPDQIEVVTTQRGKEEIERTLLSGEPSIWDAMILDLKSEEIKVPKGLRFGTTNISVIPDEKGNEASDLRTPGDNMRAADVMLETIRKHTENPEMIVYASIAGGRKSMSALMFSCMNLLGRAEDRVTHVLTTPEAIGMVSLKDHSPFCYPKPGHMYEYGPRDDRRSIDSKGIAIELFDVPFVRMRGWYQEKFGSIPPSYGTLVCNVQREAPPPNAIPQLVLDLATGVLRVGNCDCPLKPHLTAMVYVFMLGKASQDDQMSVLTGLSLLANLSPLQEN